MKLLDKLSARRRRKAHERYLAEKERQQALSSRDADQAIRDMAQNSAAQQGTFGLGN